MAVVTQFTVDQLVPELSRKLGGLQKLEVKEVRMFPVDVALLKWATKYTNWNVFKKASPPVVLLNRQPTVSYTMNARRFRADTPDEYTVNEDGIIIFNKALQPTDQVHASFTWRLFNEAELVKAVQLHALSRVSNQVPTIVDDANIPVYLFDLILKNALAHCYQTIDSEQNLYYSYSVQEQSHQVQQVHTNLQKTIETLESEIATAVDYLLFYRYQGRSRRVISLKTPYVSSPFSTGYADNPGGLSSTALGESFTLPGGGGY